MSSGYLISLKSHRQQSLSQTFSLMIHFTVHTHVPYQISDCAVCQTPKDIHQMCSKCIAVLKEPKDKESKSKITNWSKKFNCVKILNPKSSSSQHQPSSSSLAKSCRQAVLAGQNNAIGRHAESRSFDQQMAAEAVKRLLDFEK